jgi:hypothetical protein
MFGAIFKGVSKGFQAVATGNMQGKMGLQSPHLASGLVRIGRFLYLASSGWIIGAWYSGYVNMRTEPGSGPQIVLPGKPVTGSPDRPDSTPNFLANLAGGLTGQGGGNAGGIADGVGAAVNGIGATIGAAGGAIGGGPYYPGQVGRTDQGVDWGTPGPVKAIDAGVVKSVGLWPGWPGMGGLVYSTSRGNVYIMEAFQVGVNPRTKKPWKPGDAIQQGDTLGHNLGGSTGIESGFANAAGTGPLTPYAGRADGTAMPGGLAFRKLLGL